jgi:hypothetical protein
MFAHNIDGKGRRARVVLGASLWAASLAVFWIPRPWPALATAGFALLLGGGAFVLFEAARGWCALRACGIKTRL